MKSLLYMLVFFSAFTMAGQTNELTGTWGFTKDLNQVKNADTVLLSQTDLFLLKNYNLNKNGDLEICSSTRAVNAKGRTAECVWSKIGTWTYIKPILIVVLADRSINLFVNKISKKSGRLQVVEILTIK